MDTANVGPIGIIGAGRLGCSLAVALREAGYRVVAVASRDPESARALAARLPKTRAMSAQEVSAASELVFLTVPDGALAPLATAVPWRAGQAVVHCSGAIGLDVLASAVRSGARAGCFHPLQSFPSREGGGSRFRGVVCGVEGAEPLGSLLEGVARDLGASVVRLEGVDRARYHAAAVFVSNYAVALVAAARRAWALAGLPPEQAREALAPLLLGAAGSVAERDLVEALTGPIARGDVETVAGHLQALAEDPPLRELYRRLGLELLRLGLPHASPTATWLRSLLGPE